MSQEVAMTALAVDVLQIHCLAGFEILGIELFPGEGQRAGVLPVCSDGISEMRYGVALATK